MNRFDVWGFMFLWQRLASNWQRLPDNRKIRMFEIAKRKDVLCQSFSLETKEKVFCGFIFVDMSAVLFHCHTRYFQIMSIGRNLGFWGAMVYRYHELLGCKPSASH